MSRSWIGVDLDGTLSVHNGWNGRDPHDIGPPVDLMVHRIKKWLDAGIQVKIFTARVSPDFSGQDITGIVSAIQDYTELHVGARLEVTNAKDQYCIEIWDDIAVGVDRNRGTIRS